MDLGGPGDRSIPEIWFEPADTRRFAVLLGRVLAALAVVTMTTGALAVVRVGDRIEADARRADGELAAALTAAPAGQWAELVVGAGREAMVVRTGPGLGAPEIEVLVPAGRSDPETLAWLRSVAGRRATSASASYESVGPGGEVWWHTSAELPDGRALVLQRPEAEALAAADSLRWAMAALALVLALGLGAVWLVVRRSMEPSTTDLLEAVEDLRILGRLRPGVRARLDAMADRPVELKRLATAITDIETDVGRTFAQVDSLLRAAGVLGASLDPQIVLTTTLDHLEQLLGADRSSILRYDHRLNSFEVVTTRGHRSSYLAAMTGAAVDPLAPSIQAIRRRTPIQLSDTESEFTPVALRERARANGYRCILAVPLPPVLEQPTVLLLHRADPYTYSHDEIDLSMSFAAIAAAALRNAELFARTDQDLSRQSSRLSAIIESVGEGLLVESPEGTVIYANSAMRSLTGPAPVGGTTTAFLASVLSSCARPVEASQEIGALTGREGAWYEVELGPPDDRRTFRVRAFDVTDGRDTALGRGLVWTDVTADRALEDMKAGLLATVSHEFRTPLALIKGYATTLLADDVDWHPDDRHDFLGLVVTEADRLSALVQRLLDLRRIDAGMLDLHTVPVELETLVTRAVDGIGPDRYRVRIEPAPPCLVAVDEPRIVTALRNLLENACQYSPPDTVVDMVTRVVEGPEGAGTVEVDVIDRGPGVPDHLAATIFDVFVRGRADGDGTGGTGLGLAIARGFVEAHGGRIELGPGPDGGSMFRVTLPLPAPAPIPAGTGAGR